MKTILVDAINGLILRESASIDSEMFDMLEAYDANKVIVTGANEEERKEFNLHDLPYDLFSLQHNPEKSSSEYYIELLNEYDLKPEDVVYFEHNIHAVTSATSVGIKTYFFDHVKRDLKALKEFLDNNL